MQAPNQRSLLKGKELRPCGTSALTKTHEFFRAFEIPEIAARGDPVVDARPLEATIGLPATEGDERN